ncbi:MAG: CoA-binding protein [Microcystaceae cyanobacterium]
MKLTPDSKLIIQGITEPIATQYAQRMRAAGTNIVAGVSVGEGGNRLDEIPLYDLVETAIAEQGEIDTSLIFVPPYKVLDAALEAIAAKIRQLIIITKTVPPLDMVRLLEQAEETNTFILGSGSHGLIIPEKLWMGIGEYPLYKAGNVGIISRGDRLMDEVGWQLTQGNIGQSIAVGLGTDPITGSNFEQWLEILEEDEQTEVIVLVGYPHSPLEKSAAEYITHAVEKPVILYLTGIYAPLNAYFGDAEALLANRLAAVPLEPDFQPMITAFEQAGVAIAHKISEIPSLVTQALSPKGKR